MSMYQPGDTANGYILGTDMQWHPTPTDAVLPYQPAVRRGTPVIAWIGLVLGGIGFFFLPIVFSLAGLICGAVGWDKARRDPLAYTNSAAILATILSGVGLAYGVYAISKAMDLLSQI